MLLVVASDGDEPVAAGLYLFDDRALYGRYWGSVREYDALHFEVCYYQGIEFAIERGLAEFDPGVQGEHKILRGFEPVLTYSLHWLAEPAFQDAVADFCQREARHVHARLAHAFALADSLDGGTVAAHEVGALLWRTGVVTAAAQLAALRPPPSDSAKRVGFEQALRA